MLAFGTCRATFQFFIYGLLNVSSQIPDALCECNNKSASYKALKTYRRAIINKMVLQMVSPETVQVNLASWIKYSKHIVRFHSSLRI